MNNLNCEAKILTLVDEIFMKINKFIIFDNLLEVLNTEVDHFIP